MKNISAYIHFPFCVKKCYYCDFYSIANLSGINKFVESLIKEIELRGETYNGLYSLDSIFFGGGTPSLLSGLHLEKIFNAFSMYFHINSGAEITLECNPNSADSNNFKDYKSLGVNRVSIGVQSFIPSELEFLQRLHSPEEAKKAIVAARSIFDNLNLDLMYSVPGQTMQTLTYNINKALELETDHVSAYSLIYEEGTGLLKALKAGKIKPTGDDLDSDFSFLISESFKNSGFEHYEVSNFAKPGKRCKHNMAYWEGKEYTAFGPSAHGFLNNERYNNFANLGKYQDLISQNIIPTENTETIDSNLAMEENIFLGLRATGINLDNFKNSFNIDLYTKTQDLIKALVKDELAQFENSTIRLTSKGYRLCDEITLKFLSALENDI